MKTEFGCAVTVGHHAGVRHAGARIACGLT